MSKQRARPKNENRQNAQKKSPPLNAPKTAASRRTPDLPQTAVLQLQEYIGNKAVQAELGQSTNQNKASEVQRFFNPGDIADGISKGLELASNFIKSAAAIKLSGSVGRGGENNVQDVLAVQQRLRLLGFLTSAEKPAGHTKEAIPDSALPATIMAIERYQKEVLKFRRPDGRVDPGGKTVKALNNWKQTAGTKKASSPSSKEPASTPTTAPAASLGKGGNLPRADMGPKQSGRAYMLDWNSKHKNIKQNKALREVFEANLEVQIATIFKETLTQAEVLKRIEAAEAAGDQEKADQLRTKLHIASQYAVVETLEVKQSERYKKQKKQVEKDGKTVTKTSTYCNIYAYDVVTAMGGYLPRVWWREKALKRIHNGEQVKPVYDKTVDELTANRLTKWVDAFGGEFGWQQAKDMTSAQSAANQGKLVIILAANANPKRSGHVTVLMPETEQHKAVRDEESGDVLAPLQSQAGLKNFKYDANFKKRRKQWWEDHQHADGAAWIFEGKPSSPLLTPEQLGFKDS